MHLASASRGPAAVSVPPALTPHERLMQRVVQGSIAVAMLGICGFFHQPLAQAFRAAF